MPVPFGPPWVLTNLLPANPTPGAAYTLTFAAGSWYHILGLRVALTTSGTVANRTLFAQYLEPGGNGAGTAITSVTQPASLTYTYQVAIGFPLSGLLGNNEVLMPLLDLVVPETWGFNINAFGIQAADQIGNIVIFYESLAYV